MLFGYGANTHKDFLFRYRQHAVVSRTKTLMEILTQNNALQRFGLGLRLGSQTQTIS